MFTALRRMLADLAAPVPVPEGPADEKLAAAALLFHLIGVDGTVSPEERQRLLVVLMERFDLDAEAAEALIAAARTADLEAVDFYGFTSLLKTRLDEEGRQRVVGMMWEMVYADGVVHEFEANLVWRVAELLGVSTRDRIRLKKAAQDKAGGAA